MKYRYLSIAAVLILAVLATAQAPGKGKQAIPALKRLNVHPRPIKSDRSVRYDYDIVYVRMPRDPDKDKPWAEVANPFRAAAGCDLMLLHPDETEEVLVKGGRGAVGDPVVSFDGKSVYYTYFYNQSTIPQSGPPSHGGHIPAAGSDIFRIDVATRRITKITQQTYTPNTGAANWSWNFMTNQPGKTWLDTKVFNMHPCPLPGGRLAFVSDRNAYVQPKFELPALQLFTCDAADGSNVEEIGYLNLGTALHPIVLKNGKILFSSAESQGLRNGELWGLWSINPDGTNWEPVFSAYTFTGAGIVGSLHFQTQMTEGNIVVALYYFNSQGGFGNFYKMSGKERYHPFGPGWTGDPRNPPLLEYNGGWGSLRFPFSPYGIVALTPFARGSDGQAPLSDPKDPKSSRVGKLTMPAGAPDNHLLCVWTPGGGTVWHGPKVKGEAIDAGIYLIKSGKPVTEPGQMLLIKNDPQWNEIWPRALVPYRRIYGMAEPKLISPIANDGRLSPYLPEGTPFGLVGTSSLYKRESAPGGRILPGKVTAVRTTDMNWTFQGADAGRYSNDDIHAIRILITEPTTRRARGPKPGRLFYNYAQERLRILGEIPVRKFASGTQPIDPDGNPDTSFLAKIPADTAFTFQTLDKNGMVLNMAQTWHQLRPGEVRNNCGGCHAHSQKPTLFEKTAAGRKTYQPFDLTKSTPLITTKAHDESGKKWDVNDSTGLRFAKSAISPEYYRDVMPIFKRSCVACHRQTKSAPAGNFALDNFRPVATLNQRFPKSYVDLALRGKGANPHPRQPTRYIRKFQSRSSLLIWKVYGKRLDGYTNKTCPNNRVQFNGKQCPPREAIRGTYQGPDGEKIKVPPLTDEDRLTLVRWIDLGCPIDFDYDPSRPTKRGYGWQNDENKPVLTLTYPKPGDNASLTRILVGMYDYDTGLDMASFQVTADFYVDGVAPGRNLAARFKPIAQGVWEFKLQRPITALAKRRLMVSVKDRAGNISKIDRTFSVSGKAAVTARRPSN